MKSSTSCNTPKLGQFWTWLDNYVAIIWFSLFLKEPRYILSLWSATLNIVDLNVNIFGKIFFFKFQVKIWIYLLKKFFFKHFEYLKKKEERNQISNGIHCSKSSQIWIRLEIIYAWLSNLGRFHNAKLTPLKPLALCSYMEQFSLEHLRPHLG